MESTWVDKVFTYNNFAHAVSGGVGSFVSLSLLFPFETARTRMQVDDNEKSRYSVFFLREVYKSEGLSGLYRGWPQIVYTMFITQFVYFYVFHGTRAVTYKEPKDRDVTTDLFLGILAGIVVVFVTVPLWAANTRLKLQGAKLSSDQYKKLKHPKYKGLFHCVFTIAREEGIRTLYSGLLPALFLVCNPALQFMLYEALKRQSQVLFQSVELSGIVYFIIGGLAKFMATVATYPMQVVQCRVSAGYNKTRDGEVKSVPSLIKDLIRKQGLQGLFRGLESKLSQTILTAALMFLLYEKISSVIFQSMGVEK